MGKGEIARYEQFHLFPQCFQKACFPGASKGVIVWEWVKVPVECVKVPTRMVFVYKIQVNPIHTILKYGDYYDLMDR